MFTFAATILWLFGFCHIHSAHNSILPSSVLGIVTHSVEDCPSVDIVAHRASNWSWFTLFIRFLMASRDKLLLTCKNRPTCEPWSDKPKCLHLLQMHLQYYTQTHTHTHNRFTTENDTMHWVIRHAVSQRRLRRRRKQDWMVRPPQ